MGTATFVACSGGSCRSSGRYAVLQMRNGSDSSFRYTNTKTTQYAERAPPPREFFLHGTSENFASLSHLAPDLGGGAAPMDKPGRKPKADKASGPTEVAPRLYIGSWNNVKDAAVMKDLGIRCIVNVAKELDSEPEKGARCTEGLKAPAHPCRQRRTVPKDRARRAGGADGEGQLQGA